MRTKKKYKHIIVTETTFNRLKNDKLYFQTKIGGGKWSFNDTIKEYIKILNGMEE